MADQLVGFHRFIGQTIPCEIEIRALGFTHLHLAHKRDEPVTRNHKIQLSVVYGIRQMKCGKSIPGGMQCIQQFSVLREGRIIKGSAGYIQPVGS